MNERPFVILGGGGHAQVILSTLRRLSCQILGYTDPSSNASLAAEVEYLGGDEALREFDPDEVMLAVGVGSTRDTALRTRLFNGAHTEKFDFPPIVHPEAFVAPEVNLEEGAQVMAGAIVQPGTKLKENVVINTNATIDHDCNVRAHVHVSPGATLSGEVILEEGAHVGTGASIIQDIRVGAGSTIGAGAVVIDDVPPNSTVIGVPARTK
ncbi:acetyltransferase [Salinibacter sp.]|uniref:acetyltransferase n=1 Tax=Salinibacter sp. TaxID=2065818 RepID=UPI0021E7C2E5|nr:acetyltransferase [Salinibacter sp.]